MDDWGWKPPGGQQPTSLPLVAIPARLPDPASIPPREWLYGTRLIRRFVSVLVAPGGTGKTNFVIGCALALVTGRAILGDTVHHRVNSWILNLEDPMEELERRVAAMMMCHKIARADVEGRLFLNSGRERPLCIIQPSADGYGLVTYPDKEKLIEAALAANAGHIVVDPFVKSHSMEENNNPQMDAAAQAWAEVAHATGAAVDLMHHTRKGPVLDIESSRGGKALTDAARVGQILAPMSKDEAEDLGIPELDRWQYIRLDDAKVNMSPRAGRARWFKMEMESLGNRTVDYPNGDNVAALAPWEPPAPWTAMSSVDLNEALDIIAAGPEPGALFSPARQGKAARWVGDVLVDQLGLTEDQARELVAAWIKNGLLMKQKYHDPAQRKERTGVIVVDHLRPS
jgi:hypothetical protein